MEDQRKIDSLLEDMNNSASLFDMDTTSPVNESSEESLLDDTDVNSAILTDEEEKQKIIEEHNERVRKSPEYQAQILANQYIANARNSGIYYNGAQRKGIYKKFLRQAKKGKFNYLFDEEKQRKRMERMQKKFDSLNNPTPVHSVDELPQEAKEKLLEMVDEEPWHDTKPEIID